MYVWMYVYVVHVAFVLRDRVTEWCVIESDNKPHCGMIRNILTELKWTEKLDNLALLS